MLPIMTSTGLGGPLKEEQLAHLYGTDVGVCHFYCRIAAEMQLWAELAIATSAVYINRAIIAVQHRA